MTITLFVPDWNATPEMAAYAQSRKGLTQYTGGFDGNDVQFSATEGCDIILLKSRAETLPGTVRGIPMRSIQVIKHNSPITVATDGLYKDGLISARVETYIKEGVAQQSIRVVGTDGTTVEELNQWFDDLLAGKKADKNVNPITYPTQPSRPDDVNIPCVDEG